MTYPDQVRRQERAEARKKKRGRARPIGMAVLRVAELNREFSDRYGAMVLPDDDSARDDIEIMLHHLARRHGDTTILIGIWLRDRAPWFGPDERDRLLARVLPNPLRFRADTLAARIGLTADRRTRLKIRTIGAVDQSAEQRAEQRRLAKIEYKRRRRAEQKARGPNTMVDITGSALGSAPVSRP